MLKENLSGCEFTDISAEDAVLSAKYPFCNVCSSPCSAACYKGTALEKAFDEITSSDFVIFGSPTYFGAVSAQLKAFFDKSRRIRDGRLWLNKPMAVLSSGTSKYGGQQAVVRDIQDMALVQGMTIVGDSGPLTGMGHLGVSMQRGVVDEYTQNRIKALAERILMFKK